MKRYQKHYVIVLALLLALLLPVCRHCFAEFVGLPKFNQMMNLHKRDAYKAWADNATIAEINQCVGALTNADRQGLCKDLLDSNATGAARSTLLSRMYEIISNYNLGFYTHIFSYTTINLEGDGFFYCGSGQVKLANESFISLDIITQRNVMMHECFHSFNDTNAELDGALNEGSAIWVYERAFGTESPFCDFAEATYGTKLYYKVYMDNPNYPLQAPSEYTCKFIEVFTWLSEKDPSRLPWWDNDLLQKMFDRYYSSLDRDVDFFSTWLPSVKKARDAMLLDPEMQADEMNRMPTVPTI